MLLQIVGGTDEEVLYREMLASYISMSSIGAVWDQQKNHNCWFKAIARSLQADHFELISIF